VKDLAKDYKEQELDVREPALFLRDRLNEGLYCGHKGKGYATEAKRRASRTMIKRLEAEDNPKRVLKPEEDQGYASVLLAVGAKRQP